MHDAGIRFPADRARRDRQRRRDDRRSRRRRLAQARRRARVGQRRRAVDRLARRAARRGSHEFAARGIAQAAIQQHCAGDEIKFYGVAGGALLSLVLSRRAGARATRSTCRRSSAWPSGRPRRRGSTSSAATSSCRRDGDLTLIDLNDWPSFAPCRDRASEAIAGYLMRRVDVAWNPGLVSSANESAV